MKNEMGRLLLAEELLTITIDCTTNKVDKLNLETVLGSVEGVVNTGLLIKNMENYKVSDTVSKIVKEISLMVMSLIEESEVLGYVCPKNTNLIDEYTRTLGSLLLSEVA